MPVGSQERLSGNTENTENTEALEQRAKIFLKEVGEANTPDELAQAVINSGNDEDKYYLPAVRSSYEFDLGPDPKDTPCFGNNVQEMADYIRKNARSIRIYLRGEGEFSMEEYSNMVKNVPPAVQVRLRDLNERYV